MNDDFSWMDEEPVRSTVESILPAILKTPVNKKKKRPVALVRAERKLSVPQRFYLRLLCECETIAAADILFWNAGYVANRTTLYRWRLKTPRFVEAKHLMEEYIFACSGFSKEKILNDAEKIKEIALTPKPVLYKGRATQFKEVELGAALRALELQGKGIGLNDSETQRMQVNIDIDFSGRIANKPEITVIEGESESV